jgi:hypothetical protein
LSSAGSFHEASQLSPTAPALPPDATHCAATVRFGAACIAISSRGIGSFSAQAESASTQST